MSDQNINYVVTATDTASPAFDKVDKAIEKTTKSTHKHIDAAKRSRLTMIDLNRVVQDAPFGWVAIQNNIDPLISSFQTLRLEAKSTGGAFKMLVKSFMGPSGVIMLISLVVSGITAYIMATRGMHGATKATDDYTKSIEALKAAMGKLLKLDFKIKPFEVAGGDIDSLLTRFETKLKVAKMLNDEVLKFYAQTSRGGTAFLDLLGMGPGTGELGKETVIFQGIVDKLKAMKLEFDATTRVAKELGAEINKIGKYFDLGGTTARGLTTQPGLKMPTSMKGASTKFKPVVSPGWDIEDLKKEFPALNVIANSFVDTFRQNFIGAWEDAFGRANSLFEQLLQNIAGGLMDLVSQSVSNSIFTFLAASIGLPIGRSVSGGGSQIIIENKLGEDTFERGVYKSYGGASQRYKKVYRG